MRRAGDLLSLRSPEISLLQSPVSPLQNGLHPPEGRLCAPPASPTGGLSQVPWDREGAALQKVVQWGRGAEDGAGIPGKRRLYMLRVFRLKWFLICLAE